MSNKKKPARKVRGARPKAVKKQLGTIMREKRIRNAKPIIARLHDCDYDGIYIDVLEGNGDWLMDVDRVRIVPLPAKRKASK